MALRIFYSGSRRGAGAAVQPLRVRTTKGGRRPPLARRLFSASPTSTASTASTAASGATPPRRPGPSPDWNQFIYLEPTDGSDDADTASTHCTFTLAVKDNIVTHHRLASSESSAPQPASTTTCGSRMLQGYESPFEATIVTQLRRRGAHVVGKTNLDEFGMGSHSTYSHWGAVQAPTPTPMAEALSVGGSSGGSSVAVRLGAVDVALGTDTGGSVRLPAAYGGIVGFKPSYGMLSRFGVVPYANSLDTVGLLARDVAPIRRLIVGADGGDGEGGLWREADDKHDPTSLTLRTRLRLAAQRSGYAAAGAAGADAGANANTEAGADGRPLQGLTFGIPLEYNIAELDPQIRAAWVAAATRVRALGATVAAVSLPSTRHALSAYYVLAPAEAASNLARYDGVRYGRVGVSSTATGRVGEADEADEAVKTEARRDEAVAASAAADADAAVDVGDGGGAALYERVRGVGFGAEVQRRILLGAYVLSSSARDNYFLQAQRVRRLVVRDFDTVFRLPNPLRDADPDADPDVGPGVYGTTSDSTDGARQRQDEHIDLCDLPEGLPLFDKKGPARVDFLLCPTAPTPAPRLADVAAAPSPVDAYINDVFTVPASLAGLPAISIPAAPLPLTPGDDAACAASVCCPGLQLIGQFWDDARLLQVAETLTAATFTQPEDREALAKFRATGTAKA